ncbi:hypothetical protein [Breoghania sp.]|nr:hypothetical protein [Breoghania sp.]MDJ0933636.1 hypothetical protein [Breoghania sp.]
MEGIFAQTGNIERSLNDLTQILATHRAGVDDVMVQIDLLKRLDANAAA